MCAAAVHHLIYHYGLEFEEYPKRKEHDEISKVIK